MGALVYLIPLQEQAVLKIAPIGWTMIAMARQTKEPPIMMMMETGILSWAVTVMTLTLMSIHRSLK